MMTNPVIASLAFQSEMLIAYFFFSNVTEKRRPTWQCLLIGFVLFEWAALANALIDYMIWMNIANTILAQILFACICFQMPLRKSFFYSIALMVVSYCMELAVVAVVSAFRGVTLLEFQSDVVTFLLECPTSKLLYFLATSLLSRTIKPSHQHSKVPFVLFLYPAAAIVNCLVLSYICIVTPISPAGQYLIALLSTVMFFITLLLVIYYQRQAEKDNENMRIQSEYRRLQTEKAYYDILDQQNQQLRIFAHDTRNHLAAIQSLNKDPKIAEYVAALSGSLESYSHSCQSGNVLLDVILGKYTLECQRRGIQFDYNVAVDNLKDIEDMDLVSILGNLLDNALEAAGKTGEKKVSLETICRNGYRVLIIRNSSMPPEEKDGTLLTSKPEGWNHGFGLKSVRKTLKKYQGDLQWDYDGQSGTFSMTVMIGAPFH